MNSLIVIIKELNYFFWNWINNISILKCKSLLIYEYVFYYIKLKYYILLYNNISLKDNNKKVNINLTFLLLSFQFIIIKYWN